MSDLKTSGPNIPQTYADPDSWMNGFYNNGDYRGSDLDRALDAWERPDEGVLLWHLIQILWVRLSRYLE